MNNRDLAIDQSACGWHRADAFRFGGYNWTDRYPWIVEAALRRWCSASMAFPTSTRERWTS
jgi:hypothetical protein